MAGVPAVAPLRRGVAVAVLVLGAAAPRQRRVARLLYRVDQVEANLCSHVETGRGGDTSIRDTPARISLPAAARRGWRGSGRGPG